MSLTCDRCFIGLTFLGSFKLSPSSDFDFCKDCWLTVIKDDSGELSHFRGADTNSCDLKELVKMAIGTGRYLNKIEKAVAFASAAPRGSADNPVAGSPAGTPEADTEGDGKGLDG
jgi:hypothetical protein